MIIERLPQEINEGIIHNKIDEIVKFINSLEVKEEKTEWKPRQNDLYYIVDNDLEVSTAQYGYGVRDGGRIKFHNYFKTEEEAEKCAEYLKDCLRKFKENL